MSFWNSNCKYLIIFSLITLVFVGCTNHKGISSWQEDDYRPRQIIEGTLKLPPATDNIEIPLAYNSTGFLNFAGELSSLSQRDYYMGLRDPEVIGIQIGGWWSQIEISEGVYDWTLLDNIFELWDSYGKGVVLCFADSYFNTHDTPKWIFDTHNIRRIAEGHIFNFESAHPLVNIVGSGRLTTDRNKVIDGIRSAHATQRGVFFETTTGVLSSGKVYGIQFDFLSHTSGTYRVSVEGKVGSNTVRESHTWQAVAGERGLTSWTTPLIAFRDPKITIEVIRGDVSVDNITIHEITNSFRGNVGMPNYFDPRYLPLFEQFVEEMAKRYAQHPALLGVYITGIGHWGEPNLTGDEADLTSRILQWHTFGYDEKKYIEYIEKTVHMFRKHFPTNNLILVTGGWGINPVESDQEMLYWSLAHIIDRYGLIKKFNGIQELHGLWQVDLEPKSSHRFRMNDHTNIYLETAAQSYRNAFGYEPHWTGKGLTLMNKVLMEGTSWMNLYTHDLVTRNVNKYIPFAAEQLGHELYNNQYILFGYYPEANIEHPFSPVPYYNIFDGIFHNQHVSGNAQHIFSQAIDYSIEEGEHAIHTAAFDSEHFLSLRDRYHRNVRPIPPPPTEGETWIELDVHSRKRYGGMYGTTMTISYLDRGEDSLQVQLLQLSGTDVFRTIDVIQKSDSNTWKDISYYVFEYFTSWQNRAEDDHVIIRIGDKDDGRDWIRAVFLDYVAAQDYKTEPLVQFDNQKIDENEYIQVYPGKTLVREFSLPLGSVAHKVSIPYWHGGPLTTKNLVRVRFLGLGSNGWELLRDNEYFYGKTGDYIELYGAGRSDFVSYRVEMEHQLGEVGWLSDDHGEPLLIVSQYVVDTSPFSDASLLRPYDESEHIWFEVPTVGLELTYTFDNTPTEIVVEKLVPNTTNWTVISPPLMPTQGNDEKYRIFFEPQTPGIYRIQSSTSVPSEVVPLSMVRARTPKVALQRETGEHIAVFPDFDSWNVERAVISGTYVEGEEKFTRVYSLEPKPKISGQVEFQGGRNQYVNFTISNPSPAQLVRLYWRSESQEFSPQRSMYVPIVPNDPTVRWYTYNVGEDMLWMNPDGNHSPIVELAFEIVFSFSGGYVDIGSLWIGEKQELFVLDFTVGRNIQRTLLDHQSARNQIVGETLLIEGRNANFIWPKNMDTFWGEAGQMVVITLSNSSDADRVSINFEIQKRNEEQKTHHFETSSVHIDLIPYDGEYRTYSALLPWDNAESQRVFELFVQANNTKGSLQIQDIRVVGKQHQ